VPAISPAVTGTNTEKIDQVIGELAEIKAQLTKVNTTIRIYTVVFVLIAPLVVSLLAYLTMTTVTLAADVRNLTAQVGRIEAAQKDAEREMRDFRERLIKIENKQRK
jgi:hypothetical protein